MRKFLTAALAAVIYCAGAPSFAQKQVAASPQTAAATTEESAKIWADCEAWFKGRQFVGDMKNKLTADQLETRVYSFGWNTPPVMVRVDGRPLCKVTSGFYNRLTKRGSHAIDGYFDGVNLRVDADRYGAHRIFTPDGRNLILTGKYTVYDGSKVTLYDQTRTVLTPFQ